MQALHRSWIGLGVLAGATAFSVLADSVFALSLAWVLAATDRLGLLSALLVIVAATRLGMMPIGGSLADRYSKVMLLRFSATLRALAMVGIATALSLGHSVVAMVLMGLLGVASAVHYPADRAIVVELVTGEQLERANGILQTVTNTSNVAGPVTAGILVAVIGGNATILVAGAAYVLAFLTLLALRSGDDQRDAAATEQSMWVRTVAGVRYARADRPLMMLLIVVGVMNLGFIGPFAIAIPAHVLDALGGSPPTLAWLQSGFASGSILGALIVASVWKRPAGPGLIGSVLFIAIAQTAVALTTDPIVAIGALTAGGIASGIANVVLIVAIQRRTPKAYIGRLMSLVMLLSMGLTPLSHALAGILTAIYPPSGVLLGGAVLIFSGGLLAMPVVTKGPLTADPECR